MAQRKEKQIFLLFRELPPPFHGGAPIIIRELFLRLKAYGLIISTSRVTDPDGQEIFDEAHIHRHPYLATMHDPDFIAWPQPFRFALRYFTYLLWNLAIVYLGLRNPIDCIFLGRMDYAYPGAILLRCLKRVPLVTLLYGEESSQIKRRATPDWKLHSLFFRAFVRRIDRPIMISEAARRDLQSMGLAEKCVVIPPGVDTELIKPPQDKGRLRRKFAPDADLLLLCLSRLVERKGQDRVIESFAELHAKYPGARLIIAGSGPTEQRLRELARDLGVESLVHFHGEVGYMDQERVELLQAADIFLMPNRRINSGDLEGFGIVFLEANACGVPVIGGNDGGVPEAIDHGRSGFVVDAETPVPVTEALDRLMGDPALRERMGAEGRKRVVEHYSWDRMAERFKDCFDDLVNE